VRIYQGAMKMQEYKDAIVKTTEAMVIESGYRQLSGEELTQRIVGKTIRGDYYVGREYVGYVDENGTIDGTNDLGTYCVGEWSVDVKENTFTVKWRCYWDNWTGRAYDVDGVIKFFDSTTYRWRTTFKKFEDGKRALKI